MYKNDNSGGVGGGDPFFFLKKTFLVIFNNREIFMLSCVKFEVYCQDKFHSQLS